MCGYQRLGTPREVEDQPASTLPARRNALVNLTDSARVIGGNPQNAVTAVSMQRSPPIPLRQLGRARRPGRAPVSASFSRVGTPLTSVAR